MHYRHILVISSHIPFNVHVLGAKIICIAHSLPVQNSYDRQCICIYISRQYSCLWRYNLGWMMGWETFSSVQELHLGLYLGVSPGSTQMSCGTKFQTGICSMKGKCFNSYTISLVIIYFCTHQNVAIFFILLYLYIQLVLIEKHDKDDKSTGL